MTDPATAIVNTSPGSHADGRKTDLLSKLDRLHPPRTVSPPYDEADDNLSPLDDSDLASGRYLARLTAVACLGGLQFGWDTGIASGMLVAIHSDLGHDLTEGEQGLIVSATTVGAILGSIIAGRVADWLGRKKVMIASGVLFLLGALEQAASQVVRELVLGRMLVGLGVGMASMVVPTYLAEVAPTKVRGRLVGINNLLVTGGQVVAYVIDAAFYNLPHGWRWMVLAGGVPAVAQLMGMIYLDESPRWLVAKGRLIRARKVLQKIYPAASVAMIDMEIERISLSMEGTVQREAFDPDADAQYDDQESNTLHATLDHITSAPAQLSHSTSEVKSKLSQLLQNPNHRRALVIACGLQFFQQATGFNSLMYFSSRLLLMAGFVANPNAAAVGIAVANFMGTIVSMRYIDGWGRRKLLLYTTCAMTFLLALVAIGFSQIDVGPITGDPDITQTTTGGAWPYLTLAFMVAFTFAYALGLGIVPWLIQSEIFSGQVRGIGAGLATATNWSTNLLVSATFLHLVRAIKPHGCFGLFCVVAALSCGFTWFKVPEMKGVSLSDVDGSFGGRQGNYQAVALAEAVDN
ncbi:related to myo-inositol transporter [Melanopsichium pennsylvanicum]|uniref:Related to myo-inositol transporter n=2 Tax=Melanopsichium pennsylvanicum TaxID=63383 RepID=A0AAJ5C3E8_9BASI|nr:related to myo-inositol transporter [Melanopsichium pennsylvanicum 4]SNX82545.1 related to myo-inositol transporter [Melanopsichium pennsylvanicum]